MNEVVKVPMELFEDFLGNEVRVGDHVVYATTSGRSPVQKYAEVVSIVSKQESVSHFFSDTGGARGTASSGHWGFKTRTTLQVGVRELSNGRGFTRWDTRVYDENWRRVEGASKPARVTYPMPDNMVKVRSAEEIELAEREAEARALPRRAVFGSQPNLITFGEASYDA